LLTELTLLHAHPLVKFQEIIILLITYPLFFNYFFICEQIFLILFIFVTNSCSTKGRSFISLFRIQEKILNYFWKFREDHPFIFFSSLWDSFYTIYSLLHNFFSDFIFLLKYYLNALSFLNCSFLHFAHLHTLLLNKLF
jgi:hypothetical protein